MEQLNSTWILKRIVLRRREAGEASPEKRQAKQRKATIECREENVEWPRKKIFQELLTQRASRHQLGKPIAMLAIIHAFSFILADMNQPAMDAVQETHVCSPASLVGWRLSGVDRSRVDNFHDGLTSCKECSAALMAKTTTIDDGPTVSGLGTLQRRTTGKTKDEDRGWLKNSPPQSSRA